MIDDAHASPEREKTRPTGVYYPLTSYAGILRRFAVVLIDGFFLLLVLCVASAILEALPTPLKDFLLVKVWILFSYLYLSVLKSTRAGTVGYLLTGVRLVDLRGERPSLWRTLYRALFLVLGPITLLIDIFWIGGDDNRQSLRDKLAGTYVIRRSAQPAGRGPIAAHRVFLLCYTFQFPEVRKDAPDLRREPPATPVPEDSPAPGASTPP